MKQKIGLSFFCILLFLGISLPVLAAAPQVVDQSGLLSQDTAHALAARAGEISQEYNFDLVLLTVDSLGGKTATAYADDFFDYNGYGAGPERDGILLLVSMEARDFAISTRGYGITAFTDYGCEALSEDFLPYLSDGEYDLAFTHFVENVALFLEEARTNAPYDFSNPLPGPDLTWMKILVVLLGAGGIALLVALVLKAQLNTARPQGEAHQYVSNFNLRVQRDLFLYSHTSRIKKEEPPAGGSSTHIGSSGASHGGSSGKF